MGKLTAIRLRQIKTGATTYTLADGGGLTLYVMANGTCTWRYRYRFTGKSATITLGQYPDVSLAQARALHAEAKKTLAKGKNPTVARKERKKQIACEQESLQAAEKNSFQQIADEWMAQQKEKWSENHANTVAKTLLDNAYPVIGSIPVDQINPPDILKVIRPIENRGSLEMASKVLQRVKAVCKYAV